MRIGSLCTGYGGLDMGVQAALGGELAWVCDLDPAASALLAHHHPDVPNHHDLTATDWSQVEQVDLITAGWPCQPWSQAGRRKGTADERAIWPAVAAAVRALRPGLVVLENVPAIATAGELARAVGDLAAVGYVGSWCSVRASDVGAPHRRERIFIVAADSDADAQGGGREAGSRPAGTAPGRRGMRPGPADGGESPADAVREPRSRAHAGTAVAGAGGRTDGVGAAEAGRRDSAAPDASRPGSQGDHGAAGPTAGRRLDQRRAVAEQRATGRGAEAAADGTDRDLALLDVAAGRAPVDDPRRYRRTVATHPAGDGRHEGRPQPTRLLGGSDAALSGDATPDVCPHCGHDTDLHDHDGFCAHGQCDGCWWGDAPTPDTSSGSDSHVPVSSDPTGQPFVPIAGPGHRDRVGEPSPGVLELGRVAAELAWGPYEPAIRRWETVLGRPAPVPTVLGARGGRQLSPWFVQWVMGLPEEWVTDVPGLTRNQMLKLLGNGVVPQQAEAALRYLLPLLAEAREAA